MKQHRGLIIFIVSIVAAALAGFWLWASPTILSPSAPAMPFFSIFGQGLNKIKQETAGVLQEIPSASKEAILTEEDIAKIKAAVEEANQETTETLPRMPEAGDK